MGEEALYHLIPATDLAAAKTSGLDYFPRTYQQDGFTHLTGDASLLLSVANQFYQDSPDDWLLLVLDPAKLLAEVRFEPAAPVGEKPPTQLKQDQPEALFPHLYGGINLDAVIKQLAVRRDPTSGRFLAIEDL